MTTFDASGGPPILGDEGVAPGIDGGDENMRCVFGEASSDSDEVTACRRREGGDGEVAAREECPGIGIGRDDEGAEDAAAVEASCASLALRMAATHALASCCDSAWR
jgi:hypothetical protein